MSKLRRLKEDKGSSNTVSFILIIFFVMIMLVSFIDVGVYFNVKNEMRSAAENGARNVAIYGGTTVDLREARDANDAVSVVHSSISSNYDAGSTVEVLGAECGPTSTNAAGSEVWCTVKYKYNGLAGKFGMFNLSGDKIVEVKGSAVSEVGHK